MKATVAAPTGADGHDRDLRRQLAESRRRSCLPARSRRGAVWRWVPARSSRMQREIARQSNVQTPLESAYGVPFAVSIAWSRSRTPMIGATGPKVSRATSSALGGTWSSTAGRSSAPSRAAQQRRACAHSILDARLDPNGSRLVDHRTHLSSLVQRIAGLGFGGRGHPRRQLVGDLIDRMIRLTAVHRCPEFWNAPPARQHGRLVEVGIGEHEQRVVAPETRAPPGNSRAGTRSACISQGRSRHRRARSGRRSGRPEARTHRPRRSGRGLPRHR